MPVAALSIPNLPAFGMLKACRIERPKGSGRTVIRSYGARPCSVVIVTCNAEVDPVPIERPRPAQAPTGPHSATRDRSGAG